MTTEQALIALLLNRVTELETQLKYDRLTKAQSQSALISKWEEIGEVTIIAVDVAGLGEVNRLQGHDKGDLLLQQVAKDLKLSVRASDCVYRRGGDEFVVIIPCGCVDAERVEKRVRMLPYDLYIGSVSGYQQISILVQAAFSQVECQKNRRKSK